MGFLNRFKLGIQMLSNQLWMWIWSRLDNEFKRMCLLASLHAVISNCKEPNPSEIAELNSKMRLVKDENALRFPMLMGSLIWKDIKNVDKFDLKSQRYVERIARKAPCWLKYTDDSSFKTDLQQLLSYSHDQRMTSC